MESATCKRELVIEIPLKAVRSEAERTTAELARTLSIPGFRPGRAPRSLIQQRFRDEIKDEVVQNLLPKFFDRAVREQKLHVLGRPRFEELKFEDDQPVTCKAAFEVYPEFELQNYKGLQVEEPAATVSDEDVEEALKSLQEKAATFEVITDRPSQDGDYLDVSYRGTDLKDEKRTTEVKNGTVHLQAEGILADFTENLRGAKAGDRREFEVNYPDDFPHKKLAGRSVRYHVEVQAIKAKVLPPLDDEFAKTVSEHNTLEELRGFLREGLLKRAGQRSQNEAKHRLLEQLEAAHVFPVPEAMVEAQVDARLERFLEDLLLQGIDPRTAPLDWRELRTKMRPKAAKEVRGSLILEKIAEQEKIEVSEAELDQAIRELAEDGRESAAAIKTRLTRDGGLARLQSSRKNRKTLDFIYSHASIQRAASENPEGQKAEDAAKV